jgi:hypothetical protein
MVARAGAIIPLLLYFPASEERRLALRTAVVLTIKLSSAFVSAHAFTTDANATQLPLPLLVFRTLLTGRVISHFSIGLGLHLPLRVDLPLQLLCVASAMATAIPRQCGLRYTATHIGSTAGPTLFQLNHQPFLFLQDVLDWPFSAVTTQPDVFALSETGLCVAVYSWVQMVVAFLLPATVLWATEHRERRRFLQKLQHTLQAAAAAALLPPTPRGEVDSSTSPWIFFAFLAQLAWCLIRTACKLWL